MSSSIGLGGRLYRYRSSPGALQAFESPAEHDFKKYAIYLGGLTDGLLACPYVEALAAACADENWALVQPILSSSYMGYGTGSLSRDSEELDSLMAFLHEQRGAVATALIGHSTGCQNSVHFLRHASPSSRLLVRVAALQAPVSDREAATLEPGSSALLARAQDLIAEGRGADVFTMHYGIAAMTADRYASLVGRGGEDDLFSSDFTDAELSDRLGHMSTKGQRMLPMTEAHPGLRTLIASSLADEYVPRNIDSPALVRRFQTAMDQSEFCQRDGEEISQLGDTVCLYLEAANHNLSSPPSAAGTFVAAVARLLGEVE